MSITVKVEGAKALEAKLDFDTLVQPELKDAIQTIVARVEHQGHGLGARNNSLMAQIGPLTATVQSTLNQPRTKGTAWQRKNEQIFDAMAGSVLEDAAKGVEKRWGRD